MVILKILQIIYNLDKTPTRPFKNMPKFAVSARKNGKKQLSTKNVRHLGEKTVVWFP